MKYLMYCPRCGYENYVDKIPYKTLANPRDGWGRMIRHFECPKCKNLDAGAMEFSPSLILYSPDSPEWSDEIDYFKYVISLYQDIRTPL